MVYRIDLTAAIKANLVGNSRKMLPILRHVGSTKIRRDGGSLEDFFVKVTAEQMGRRAG